MLCRDDVVLGIHDRSADDAGHGEVRGSGRHAGGKEDVAAVVDAGQPLHVITGAGELCGSRTIGDGDLPCGEAGSIEVDGIEDVVGAIATILADVVVGVVVVRLGIGVVGGLDVGAGAYRQSLRCGSRDGEFPAVVLRQVAAVRQLHAVVVPCRMVDVDEEGCVCDSGLDADVAREGEGVEVVVGSRRLLDEAPGIAGSSCFLLNLYGIPAAGLRVVADGCLAADELADGSRDGGAGVGPLHARDGEVAACIVVVEHLGADAVVHSDDRLVVSTDGVLGHLDAIGTVGLGGEGHGHGVVAEHPDVLVALCDGRGDGELAGTHIV